MEFNVYEYMEALEEFLIKAEQFKGDNYQQLQDSAERIGKFLRLSVIEITLYDNLHDEQKKQGFHSSFCNNGKVDRSRSISLREVGSDDGITFFQVFQRIGDVDWSQTERDKIQTFLKMLFSFSGRTRLLEMAEFLTYHDKTFGNYNITYFMKTAGMYIAQRRIDQFCVCHFNFRRLSVINQLIGKTQGTKVMKLFLTGLENLLAPDEFIFRIGGDNFGILFRKEKLEQIKNYLAEQSILYDTECNENVLVSVSAGFFMIPHTVQTAAEIIDKVNVAINISRKVLHEQFVFYDEKIMLQLQNKKLVETLFANAVRNEEFVVFYQPKIHLKKYELAGAEALCRWIHEGELLPPTEFIPILEQNKFICTLDFYMLEHVCKDIRRWLDEGRKIVKISVNFSRCHMVDTDLLRRIVNTIDKYQVPHEYIEIELTETTTDVDFTDLKLLVFGLQEENISTSVDDFGVGYSSLNLIKELPWNTIKIDKSFLEQHEANSQNHIMLKHIVAMTQELGMECIVEGVENAEHVKVLKENNCYLAQGFYFDQPLPREVFEKRLMGMLK